ncbi:MAG: hypothetical protein RR743_01855 [Oscillospiraceae bacterium]
MKVSFEGIGENVVTFYNKAAAGSAVVGAPVKMTGNGEVGVCVDGDKFIGLAIACDAGLAAVQTEGYVQMKYSGAEAPKVGFAMLAAAAEGKVKTAAAGREYLVVDVDTANTSVGFML